MWFIATQNTLTITVVCPQKQKKTLSVNPLLCIIKLNLSCTAKSIYLTLLPYFHNEGTSNIQDQLLDNLTSYNGYDLNICKPIISIVSNLNTLSLGHFSPSLITPRGLKGFLLEIEKHLPKSFMLQYDSKGEMWKLNQTVLDKSRFLVTVSILCWTTGILFKFLISLICWFPSRTLLCQQLSSQIWWLGMIRDFFNCS